MKILELYERAAHTPLEPGEVAWLREQAAQHPFFHLPHFILARQAKAAGAQEAASLSTTAALYAHQRSRLAAYVDESLAVAVAVAARSAASATSTNATAANGAAGLAKNEAKPATAAAEPSASRHQPPSGQAEGAGERPAARITRIVPGARAETAAAASQATAARQAAATPAPTPAGATFPAPTPAPPPPANAPKPAAAPAASQPAPEFNARLQTLLNIRLGMFSQLPKDIATQLRAGLAANIAAPAVALPAAEASAPPAAAPVAGEAEATLPVAAPTAEAPSPAPLAPRPVVPGVPTPNLPLPEPVGPQVQPVEPLPVPTFPAPPATPQWEPTPATQPGREPVREPALPEMAAPAAPEPAAASQAPTGKIPAAPTPTAAPPDAAELTNLEQARRTGPTATDAEGNELRLETSLDSMRRSLLQLIQAQIQQPEGQARQPGTTAAPATPPAAPLRPASSKPPAPQWAGESERAAQEADNLRALRERLAHLPAQAAPVAPDMLAAPARLQDVPDVAARPAARPLAAPTPVSQNVKEPLAAEASTPTPAAAAPGLGVPQVLAQSAPAPETVETAQVSASAAGIVAAPPPATTGEASPFESRRPKAAAPEAESPTARMGAESMRRFIAPSFDTKPETLHLERAPKAAPAPSPSAEVAPQPTAEVEGLHGGSSSFRRFVAPDFDQKPPTLEAPAESSAEAPAPAPIQAAAHPPAQAASAPAAAATPAAPAIESGGSASFKRFIAPDFAAPVAAPAQPAPAVSPAPVQAETAPPAPTPVKAEAPAGQAEADAGGAASFRRFVSPDFGVPATPPAPPEPPAQAVRAPIEAAPQPVAQSAPAAAQGVGSHIETGPDGYPRLRRETSDSMRRFVDPEFTGRAGAPAPPDPSVLPPAPFAAPAQGLRNDSFSRFVQPSFETQRLSPTFTPSREGRPQGAAGSLGQVSDEAPTPAPVPQAAEARPTPPTQPEAAAPAQLGQEVWNEFAGSFAQPAADAGAAQHKPKEAEAQKPTARREAPATAPALPSAASLLGSTAEPSQENFGITIEVADAGIAEYKENLSKIRERATPINTEITLQTIQQRFLQNVVRTMSSAPVSPIVPASAEAAPAANARTVAPGPAYDLSAIPELEAAAPTNVDDALSRFQAFEPVLAQTMATNREQALAGTEPAESAAPSAPPAPEAFGDEPASETLARLYARQGNRAKALATLQRLALKNPAKSAYFAGLIQELNI